MSETPHQHSDAPGGMDRPAARELERVDFARRFVTHIHRDFARRHLVVPDPEADGDARLLIAGNSDQAAVHNVMACLGVAATTIEKDGEAIVTLIDRLYESASDAIVQVSPAVVEEDVDALIARADRDLLSTQGKGQVVRLVDSVFFDAVRRRASDVHIQPLPHCTLIRYRIDGVLVDVRELSKRLSEQVVSRVKLLGGMDISEKRKAQDGRATLTVGPRPIDLRISTLPTRHGERAVIRLLDTSQHLCDFDALGMPPGIAKEFLDHALRTSGIVLVTGPTGSGKTTTLYSTLRLIGTKDVNVMTIEDPIEYELTGGGLAISQTQVNEKKGLTFETGLRHILRQDPDVIMVGEIRDEPTARIAIQSSLTGHLVFSTLHTNDAPSAVTRLIDLGIEPYLVASSLSAVLAQRLVRSVHGACGGKGCDLCFGLGLLGRIGVFELLSIDESLRTLITEHASLESLRRAGVAAGMRTLGGEGARLVESGVTTEAELRRVLYGAL